MPILREYKESSLSHVRAMILKLEEEPTRCRHPFTAEELRESLEEFRAIQIRQAGARRLVEGIELMSDEETDSAEAHLEECEEALDRLYDVDERCARCLSLRGPRPHGARQRTDARSAGRAA